MREYTVECITGIHNMIGCDLDVDRLPFHTSERLMDHHFRVFQRISFSFCSSGEYDRTHRCSHADTDSDDIRLHVLHRVIDRETGCDVTTGRIDIESDRSLRIFFREEKELSDHRIRDIRVDRVAEENNPILEETRVYVIGAFLSPDFIDDRRDEEIRESFRLLHTML